MSGRMPNLFLVGAPRCGTTSMYTYLKQHPEIYLSVLKEPHFFSSDLPRPPQGVADEALYASLFAPAHRERWVGEGSVWYLESRRAPAAIHATSPGARVLVMLRNPVDMIFSLHGLYTRTGNEDLSDFEEALAAEAARARGERIPPAAYFPEGLLYTRVGRSSEKLRRYFRIFGRRRVQVVIFDDFVAAPAAVLRRTFELLGVDPTFEPELDLARARRVIRTEVLRQLRSARPEIRARLRGGGDRYHTTPPGRSLPPVLRRRLSALFAPEVEALGRLLDRDLSPWCRGVGRLDGPPARV